MTWAEMGNQLGNNAVLMSLVFGILYAMLTRKLRSKHSLKRGGSSTLSAVLVVGGVAGTVSIGVLVNLITIETAVYLGLMFTASGIPMIFESVDADHKAQVNEVLGGSER